MYLHICLCIAIDARKTLWYNIHMMHICVCKLIVCFVSFPAPSSKIQKKLVAKTVSQPQHLALSTDEFLLSVVVKNEKNDLELLMYSMEQFLSVCVYVYNPPCILVHVIICSKS